MGESWFHISRWMTQYDNLPQTEKDRLIKKWEDWKAHNMAIPKKPKEIIIFQKQK